MKSNWYKATVAKLALSDVMPDLEHDTEVVRLDAERVRLAREYEAADGALLRQIAAHLKNDGSGRWSAYLKNRALPGYTTPHERMKIAAGSEIPVVRFDGAAVYDHTHCRDCRRSLPYCVCDKSETGTCRYCGSHYTVPSNIDGWLHCFSCTLDGPHADLLPSETSIK